MNEFPDFSLAGKVALVTATGRGLGRATAIALAHAARGHCPRVARPSVSGRRRPSHHCIWTSSSAAPDEHDQSA